ncbi:ammonium transporter [Rhizobium sp. TRM95111]|uniref:ammonium transporter n=1 Tax=Rhizobium alarense TaxID=2846851 RepID=UPI001F2533F2|nr:ammonium transporter [Rhizobium alarense]MCF3640068.1 ammonium transporter [Rhizobium alarense]
MVLHLGRATGRFLRPALAGFVVAAGALSAPAAAAELTLADVKLNLDLVWMMVAAGLVMLMQVGFLLLEAGMVRSKNSINVAQKNMLDFVFGVVAFAAVGFMVAFGTASVLPIGLSGNFFMLRDLSTWEQGFFVFQVMFCGTAATIVSGAVAERMRLSAYVWGSIFLSAIIYPVFVHWAWGSALGASAGSFLGNLGFVDFAGSTVVHGTGAWVSLAACMVIGPRIGRFDANGRPVRMSGHSPVLATTGALLLFIGWIGFNGGSTTQARPDVATIIMNTVLAGGVGATVGYALGWYQDRVYLPEKANCGMLGGLVAVTAGCQVLEPLGAMVIGALGSIAAIEVNRLLEERLKIDDAVGAIGVHGGAGVVGTIGLALLAPLENLPLGSRLEQLHIQALGSALNFYWAFCAGYAFFWLLDRCAPVRVTAAAEEIGLNEAEHATRMGVGHVEDALGLLVRGNADLNMRLPIDMGDEAEKLTRLFNALMDNIQAEEAAREEQAELLRDAAESERVSAIANATFEAILMHRGGVIIDGNAQLAALYGAPLETLLGRHILEFVPAEYQGLVLEGQQESESLTRELELFDVRRTRIPVEARGRKIMLRGEEVHISCIVDLRDRKKAEQKILHLAQHDGLTGLANRSLFGERLEAAVERAAAVGAGLAVLLVDLDRFKDINDIHGHPAGDAVIRETAVRLAGFARPGDTVARLGGDEFAIVVQGIAFEAQVEDIAIRIVADMARPIDIGDGELVNCGASVGCALYPAHAETADALVARADIALYHSKNAGRHTHSIFRPGMNEILEKRRELEADLQEAIARAEFELYLQPRVEVSTAEISGYEALVRWNHPERGLIGPADFIPVAEASGKIIPIGEWVLREACRLAAGLPQHTQLSVNVSPIQFRQTTFLQVVRTVLQSTGIDPRRLELEITEGMLIDDDRRALAILKELKKLGVSIALDDFGTGYSSLSYLSRFPFDTIKIDRSFVTGLGSNENAPAIIRSIIDLGTGLGMTVVAEGIETVEAAISLVEAGCDELQGYLLGKPMPVSAVASAIDPELAGLLVQAKADSVSAPRRLADMSRRLRPAAADPDPLRQSA